MKSSQDSSKDKKELRQKDHPNLAKAWEKGESGNPGGRPKGSKNKTTLIKQMIEHNLVELVEHDVPEVVLKAFELAKEGDPAMIKLVWDTFMSKAKFDDKSGSKGTGQIVINVGSTADDKPVIDAQIIEEETDGNE